MASNSTSKAPLISASAESPIIYTDVGDVSPFAMVSMAWRSGISDGQACFFRSHDAVHKMSDSNGGLVFGLPIRHNGDPAGSHVRAGGRESRRFQALLCDFFGTRLCTQREILQFLRDSGAVGQVPSGISGPSWSRLRRR